MDLGSNMGLVQHSSSTRIGRRAARGGQHGGQFTVAASLYSNLRRLMSRHVMSLLRPNLCTALLYSFARTTVRRPQERWMRGRSAL